MKSNMAEIEKLVKGELVKPSGVIHISTDEITLIQHKCWNLLLANAYSDLDKQDSYSIKLWHIRQALGYHNVAELKKSLRKLSTTVVEFNAPPNRDGAKWEIYSLLADAVIDDEWLSYSYGGLLRQKLLNPSLYARINLAIQRNFKTKYALILYEIACDHYIRSKGRGKTDFISIEDLRRKLGCFNDKSYEYFKEFNRYVLKKAVEEINKKSDIQIEIRQKKEKKKVTAVQLIITSNKTKSGMIDEMFFPKQAEMPLAPGGELHTRLMTEYGLSEKQATDIVNNFDQQHIKDKLTYIAKRQAAGKVDNIASYTIRAFKDNYRIAPPSELLSVPANGSGNHNGIVLQEGVRIEIDDGTVHAVEEGEVIRIDRGIIPRVTIISELKAGRYKIVTADAAAEYLAPDQDEDKEPHTTTPRKIRKSRKGLHKEEE